MNNALYFICYSLFQSMLEIIYGADNPILRKKSVPVKTIDKKLVKYIKEMKVAMKKAKGVGLAAPQVGNNIRLALVTINKKVMPIINPEIISKSEEIELGEEGCLSLPGVWGKVNRHKAITLKYQDEKGDEKILKLKDFNARVVQHEIDHLDGILFIDYLEKSEEVLGVAKNVEMENM